MVNLTFLNDASVFWNLKTRYQAKMIHTYSGLFVVVRHRFLGDLIFFLVFFVCATLYLSCFFPSPGGEPIQAVPHLHPQGVQDLPWQA